ncbi:MAG TPA: manganese efflux pump [Candidatus Angelobacter sp.]
MESLLTVVLFGFMASLDNFQAACALGLLPLKRARKFLLGASFGICESVSSLAGLLLGNFLQAHFFPGKFAGIMALLASGTTILYLAWKERELDEVANDGWMIFGLPVTLSLDNLVGGAGLGANGFPPLLSAALIGAICSAMSFAGIFLGSHGRRVFPRRAAALSGVWLLVIALGSLIANR